MSAKLDIFNDIVTALDSIAELETVELWNSQFANEDREKPFNYNAVFVEFSEIAWTTTNQTPSRSGSEGDVSKQQKGDETLIMLHIAFSQLDNETISFPIISPIIDKVYLAVQGLNGEFYGPLLRVAERQDTDHDRVIDWQMDFNTMIFECGELDDALTEIPGGTLELELDKDLDIDNPVIRSGDGIS